MADTEQTALTKANNDTQEISIESAESDIKSMIYVIRNQQVMIDSDLAMLYQVETRVLNQAVKRNISRFPERFRFQLMKEESSQKVFFDGQIYDAFSLIVNLIQKAEKEITLIDGYVDVGTLNLLSKKKSDVAVTIYTQKQTKLTKADVKNFNAQYPTLKIKYTKVFHDRFLILDRTIAYHVGASLKDAGKKCFGINLIQDAGIIKDILQRLELETEK